MTHASNGKWGPSQPRPPRRLLSGLVRLGPEKRLDLTAAFGPLSLLLPIPPRLAAFVHEFPEHFEIVDSNRLKVRQTPMPETQMWKVLH